MDESFGIHRGNTLWYPPAKNIEKREYLSSFIQRVTPPWSASHSNPRPNKNTMTAQIEIHSSGPGSSASFLIPMLIDASIGRRPNRCSALCVFSGVILGKIDSGTGTKGYRALASGGCFFPWDTACLNMIFVRFL